MLQLHTKDFPISFNNQHDLSSLGGTLKRPPVVSSRDGDGGIAAGWQVLASLAPTINHLWTLPASSLPPCERVHVA